MDDIVIRVVGLIASTREDTYLNGRDPVALLQLEVMTAILQELREQTNVLEALSSQLDMLATLPE